jgi:hypothetical protein
MKTQIETTHPGSRNLITGLVEILAVFLPVLLLFKISEKWVGQDSHVAYCMGIGQAPRHDMESIGAVI